MVGGVAFMFALLVSLSSADHVMLQARHRRQASSSPSPVIDSASLPFDSSVPCPIRCLLSLSQAWAKIFSFDIPTTTMLGERDIIGGNDTITVMCNLYASHSRCLKGCDVANAGNKAVVGSVPSYTELCSDNIHEIEESAECLTGHTRTFQVACQNENDDALASATRMMSQPALKDNLLDAYCGTSKTQLYCLLPAIRQTCGDQPYEMIRALANASYTSIRISIGEKAIDDFFTECKALFTSLERGIGVSMNGSQSIDSGNTTTTVAQTSTVAVNSTTTSSLTTGQSSSTTQVIQKDEVDPYDGYQTTTPSSAPRAFLGFSTFVTLAIAFLIF